MSVRRCARIAALHSYGDASGLPHWDRMGAIVCTGLCVLWVERPQVTALCMHAAARSDQVPNLSELVY